MAITALRRLLLVHAHPDDETIVNGGTMARYAAEGTHVTLVTCTRGEFGEIMVPELAHLAWDREDKLGAHRETELAAAMAALGVTDHRFLGEPGEYHDSGWIGTPGNHAPDAFWQADVDAAAARLARVVREVRPQVLVTYDPGGGYGHLDHVQAHRVATRATVLAADPAFDDGTGSGEPHRIERTYWTAQPRSVVRADFEVLRAAGPVRGYTPAAVYEEVSAVVDDAAVDVAIDTTARGGDAFARKLAALRAHATQLTLDGTHFALTNLLRQRVQRVEYYRRAGGRGEPGTVSDDLFAGIAED